MGRQILNLVDPRELIPDELKHLTLSVNFLSKSIYFLIILPHPWKISYAFHKEGIYMADIKYIQQETRLIFYLKVYLTLNLGEKRRQFCDKIIRLHYIRETLTFTVGQSLLCLKSVQSGRYHYPLSIPSTYIVLSSVRVAKISLSVHVCR